MPAFPRYSDIPVKETSSPIMPGSMQAWGVGGKGQLRSTGQIGRVWSETFDIFKADSDSGQAFLATLRYFWRNGITFDIEHYLHPTRRGAGTGAALVQGAGQLGSTLSTDSWTNPVSTVVLKAGDIIRIAGLPPVYDVVFDAPITSGSVAPLTINPPIFGVAPADNALITYVAVRFNAVLFQEPQIPKAATFGYIGGLTLVYREMV